LTKQDLAELDHEFPALLSKLSDFKIENGQIQGKISTGGQKETFGQTWEVDLAFKTKAA
jgi:hypothetical protein